MAGSVGAGATGSGAGKLGSVTSSVIGSWIMAAIEVLEAFGTMLETVSPSALAAAAESASHVSAAAMASSTVRTMRRAGEGLAADCMRNTPPRNLSTIGLQPKSGGRG